MSFTTVMYGGPPNPKGWDSEYPPRPAVMPDPVSNAGIDINEVLRRAREQAPAARHRLRVSVLVEVDGTIRLKILDGERLVCETTGRSTISIETEL
jgi:hypothetical protein